MTLSFPRTIYQLKGEESFLNPWSSLNTKTTYRHLRREILFAIDNLHGKVQVKKPPLTEADVLRRWILALPRRNYTPPQYPHLQLWYLSKYFTPTLALLPREQLLILPNIIEVIKRAILRWQRQQNLAGQFVFGINATPFAFIKRRDGSYWPGGQSVRAFHLSCLLLPSRRVMKKQVISQDRLGLIYPSDFAINILKFWFHLPNLQDYILSHSRFHYLSTRRGLVFKFPITNKGNLTEILAFLYRFDQIAYKVQLILIHSLYKKSEHFLNNLETLLVSTDADALKEARRLHLHFEGVLPLVALEKIWAGLQKLDLAYGHRRRLLPYLRYRWKKVAASLVLNEQNEPSSFLANVPIALRPGMGYGYLVEEKAGNNNVWIMPLDTLLPKGIIEARGFSFSEKIVRHQKPAWLASLRSYIWRSFSQPATSRRWGREKNGN